MPENKEDALGSVDVNNKNEENGIISQNDQSDQPEQSLGILIKQSPDFDSNTGMSNLGKFLTLIFLTSCSFFKQALHRLMKKIALRKTTTYCI